MKNGSQQIFLILKQLERALFMFKVWISNALRQQFSFLDDTSRILLTLCLYTSYKFDTLLYHILSINTSN